jgi:mannose-6-phosphate isomerase-like protein (cupin superfamily)
VEPGETIEAPHMGMRVTCRENAASSDGEVFSFTLWMRGGATPPPMHVHPHQEERIAVLAGAVKSRSGDVVRVLTSGDTVVSPPGEPHTAQPEPTAPPTHATERREWVRVTAVIRAKRHRGRQLGAAEFGRLGPAKLRKRFGRARRRNRVISTLRSAQAGVPGPPACAVLDLARISSQKQDCLSRKRMISALTSIRAARGGECDPPANRPATA